MLALESNCKNVFHLFQVEMLKVSLTVLPVASRLLSMWSRRSRERTSFSTPNMVTFNRALPVWGQVWAQPFAWNFQAGPRRVSQPWQHAATNWRFSSLDPSENLTPMRDSPMKYQTSTVSALPKLSWSRTWLMESTPCSRRILCSRRSIAFKSSQISHLHSQFWQAK